MGEYSTLIFGCMGALWTVILLVVGAGVREMRAAQERMSEKIDELVKDKAEYVDRFADRSLNHQAHEKLYDAVDQLNVRVALIEREVQLEKKLETLIDAAIKGR